LLTGLFISPNSFEVLNFGHFPFPTPSPLFLSAMSCRLRSIPLFRVQTPCNFHFSPKDDTSLSQCRHTFLGLINPNCDCLFGSSNVFFSPHSIISRSVFCSLFQMNSLVRTSYLGDYGLQRMFLSPVADASFFFPASFFTFSPSC